MSEYNGPERRKSIAAHAIEESIVPLVLIIAGGIWLGFFG